MHTAYKEKLHKTGLFNPGRTTGGSEVRWVVCLIAILSIKPTEDRSKFSEVHNKKM